MSGSGSLLDGGRVARFGAKVIEELCHALLPLGVLFERVNDPDLAEVDGCRQCSSIGIARNEFDILDSPALRNA